MNATAKSPSLAFNLSRYFPILRLLNPRPYLKPTLIALTIGLLSAWAAMQLWNAPLWAATFIVLGALLPVGVRKWRDELREHGWVIMLLSVVVITQGVHTIEHILQWFQYHVLFWTPRQSVGLLSPADAEWVHFTWNWAVWFVVIGLLKGGLRNVWMYALLTVTTAHSLEHTYLLVRHLLVLNELRILGVTHIPAQGLPGVLGRDGWLAHSPAAEWSILAPYSGLITLMRLDVHFWWNTIEMALLLLAGNSFLLRRGVKA